MTKYFVVEKTLFKQSQYFPQVKENYEKRGFTVEEFTEEEVLQKFGEAVLERMKYDFCARV